MVDSKREKAKIKIKIKIKKTKKDVAKGERKFEENEKEQENILNQSFLFVYASHVALSYASPVIAFNILSCIYEDRALENQIIVI